MPTWFLFTNDWASKNVLVCASVNIRIAKGTVNKVLKPTATLRG
ncbi:MAG: hypothetical protein PVI26_01525 [Chitinispirillia bacterium]